MELFCKLVVVVDSPGMVLKVPSDPFISVNEKHCLCNTTRLLSEATLTNAYIYSSQSTSNSQEKRKIPPTTSPIRK
jgi:hypothetical protein